MMAGGAAPQTILVGKEKETVMVQEMEDRMMEIEDVVEILSVEATTA